MKVCCGKDCSTPFCPECGADMMTVGANSLIRYLQKRLGTLKAWEKRCGEDSRCIVRARKSVEQTVGWITWVKEHAK